MVYLFLILFHQTRIDFHPRIHAADAPQLIRMFSKAAGFDLFVFGKREFRTK